MQREAKQQRKKNIEIKGDCITLIKNNIEKRLTGLSIFCELFYG